MKAKNFKLPVFEDLPRYSIIHVGGVYLETTNSGFVICENTVCIGIWPFDMVQLSMWSITKNLPIDLKLSQIRPKIDHFKFDEKEVSNLTKLMNCPSCASMADFICHDLKKPFKIKVQYLIRSNKFKKFIFFE